MKKENESNGFLGFMSFMYFAFIGIIFIGTLVGINEIPKGSGNGIILIFLIVAIIQILMLINLIILNKGNSVSSNDMEQENPNITDGLFEKFYDNGNIKERGNYVDGKKDGLWEFFYYDGSPNGSKTFKDGRQIS